MSDKFNDRYRIPSNRLPEWDYGAEGFYFVTICVQRMTHFFGVIENNEMEFSDAGKIAHSFFQEIPIHFPNVEIDIFQIMPNHIHAILKIGEKRDFVSKKIVVGDLIQESDELSVEFDRPVIEHLNNKQIDELEKPIDNELPKHFYSESDNEKDPKDRTKNASKIWQSGILGVIIGQYKRACTLKIREIHPDFSWQTRYYDHIIRDKASHLRIIKYIKNNPRNWKDDRYFTVQK